MLIRLAAAAVLVIATTATAVAQTASPERLQVFQDWGVYTYTEAGSKVCFVASQPTNSRYSQTVSSRDPAYFLLATRPADGITNEASLRMGYTLAIGTVVTVTMDNGTSFDFFTEADNAWVQATTEPELREIEGRLVAAMRAGISMTVVGRSTRGTETTDTYSLRGITAALNRAAQECQ